MKLGYAVIGGILFGPAGFIGGLLLQNNNSTSSIQNTTNYHSSKRKSIYDSVEFLEIYNNIKDENRRGLYSIKLTPEQEFEFAEAEYFNI